MLVAYATSIFFSGTVTVQIRHEKHWVYYPFF